MADDVGQERKSEIRDNKRRLFWWLFVEVVEICFS